MWGSVIGPPRSLFLRKFVFEFTGQLVYVCRLAERLNLLLRGVDVHAHVLAQFLQHLKDGGQFLFRKHANLKIQMRAAIGLTRHSTLTDQNKDSQKHAFGRDDQREDAERKRIKCFESGDYTEIYQAPAGDQNQLSEQEPDVADNFHHYVAGSLRKSPAIKGVVLQLGDCVNVILRGIRSNLARQRIVHRMAPGNVHEDTASSRALQLISTFPRNLRRRNSALDFAAWPQNSGATRVVF